MLLIPSNDKHYRCLEFNLIRTPTSVGERQEVHGNLIQGDKVYSFQYSLLHYLQVGVSYSNTDIVSNKYEVAAVNGTSLANKWDDLVTQVEQKGLVTDIKIVVTSKASKCMVPFNQKPEPTGISNDLEISSPIPIKLTSLEGIRSGGIVSFIQDQVEQNLEGLLYDIGRELYTVKL